MGGLLDPHATVVVVKLAGKPEVAPAKDNEPTAKKRP
jgi:hypothetical protein